MAKNSKTTRPDKIIPKAIPGGEARTTGVKRKTQYSGARGKKFRRRITSTAEAFENVAKID